MLPGHIYRYWPSAGRTLCLLCLGDVGLQLGDSQSPRGRVWVFVTADEDDPSIEGVVGFQVEDMVAPAPMIATNARQLELLREKAQEIAEVVQRPISVVEFTRRAVVDVFAPESHR